MASVESGLHARVLQARPDCTASVHTHQPIASAYTLLDRPLRINNLELQKWLGNMLPCVAYAPSGTEELARLVAGAFDAGNHACLMRNHGVVCVGRDMDEARKRLAALEAACAEWFTGRLDEAPALPRASEKLLRETFSAAMFLPGQGGR
jgi:L-fuculose-phosphate aldolase